MTIYEIDKSIQELLDGAVDEETGELVIDLDAFEELQMERDRKLENLALAVKNLTAEAKAIKEEEDNLARRRRSVEASADRAMDYLTFVLAGGTFKSSKVAVSYRTSQAVELDDGFVRTASPEWVRTKDPEPNKLRIMQALKAGETIPGARLVERTSTIIK